MEDKPIMVKCGCCNSMVVVPVNHPKYEELKLEFIRLLHPEVPDEEDP